MRNNGKISSGYAQRLVNSKQKIKLRKRKTEILFERIIDSAAYITMKFMRKVVHKIEVNSLWWAGYLISMGEHDPARKVCNCDISGRKENVADFASNGAIS